MVKKIKDNRLLAEFTLAQELAGGKAHKLPPRVEFQKKSIIEAASNKLITTEDITFQDKLLSGQIFPLIALGECSTIHKIIPLIHCDIANNNIHIPEEAQIQLMEYRKILKEQIGYVILVDNSQQALLSSQKQIGIFASFKMFTAEYPAISYYLNIVPKKMVTISSIIKHKNKQDDLVEVCFCIIDAVEYIVNNQENLRNLIINCSKIFNEIHKLNNSSESIVFNDTIGNNVDYVINISNKLIKLIECTDLLKINQLEKRFENIESKLLELLDLKKKQVLENVNKKTNKHIQEMQEVPKGFSIILFEDIITEHLSLLISKKIYLTYYSILIAEQIERLYYSGNKSLLLVEGTPPIYSSNANKVPSILTEVNNISIRKDNGTHIYITPKQRVRIVEIILKDGIFYGKSKAIIESTLDNTAQLKPLLDKLITLYYQLTSSLSRQ